MAVAPPTRATTQITRFLDVDIHEELLSQPESLLHFAGGRAQRKDRLPLLRGRCTSCRHTPLLRAARPSARR